LLMASGLTALRSGQRRSNALRPVRVRRRDVTVEAPFGSRLDFAQTVTLVRCASTRAELASNSYRRHGVAEPACFAALRPAELNSQKTLLAVLKHLNNILGDRSSDRPGTHVAALPELSATGYERLQPALSRNIVVDNPPGLRHIFISPALLSRSALSLRIR